MSRSLGLGKRKELGRGRLPDKRSMNLYVKLRDGNSWQLILPLAISLVLVVFSIYRLGVVDRLNRLNALQQENVELESRLHLLNDELKEYQGVKEEYRRYNTGYLREGEQELLSRSRIFMLLDECTAGLADIRNISIQGNQVGVAVTIRSLEDIELIQDRLNALPDVEEIKVSTAKGTNNVEVEGYIIFVVKRADNDDGRSDEAVLTHAERADALKEYMQDVSAYRAEQELIGVGSPAANAAGGAASGYGAQQSGSSAANASQGSSVNSAGASQGTSVNNTGTQQSTSSNSASASQSALGTGSASSGNAANSAQGAATQHINGDEVVILPAGVSIYGFDSLEDGQRSLQGAGQ